jgi:lipopolysaccharide/colanic/teichoic acid biosynthesis glycosyltransferase
MGPNQLAFPAISKGYAPGGTIYRFAKSYVEPLVACAALIVLAPLLLLIVIAVKACDGGAILFRQTRIGKDGRPFTILKFRTMPPYTNPYQCKPPSDAPGLVTRVGRFLRDRCLDEIPQLFSIVRGDMQLIGPRPEMPFIVEQYSEQERRRLRVKPGITGLWQVCAPKNEPIHSNLEFDLYYIQNHGFALDLWILQETLKIVLGLRDR